MAGRTPEQQLYYDRLRAQGVMTWQEVLDAWKAVLPEPQELSPYLKKILEDRGL